MIKNNLFLVFFVLNFINISAQTTVSGVSSLEDALLDASPGETIIVEDGVYIDANLFINVNATSTAPVIIQARNVGSVFLVGNSRISMSGNYIQFNGFVFQDPDNLEEGESAGNSIDPVIYFDDCDNCLLENIKIEDYNISSSQNDSFSEDSSFKWVIVDGQYNEIRYCSFTGKNGVGSIINDNRDDAEEDFLNIHHNYFANRVPAGGEFDAYNDQDAIRIGNSDTSLADSSSEVHDNYFDNFFGEVEIISNKSGNNKYYNNTFRNYSGTLALRHGNNCEVYGNYFFAEDNNFSGGIRVMGESHKVYNNYIEGVSSLKPEGNFSDATGGINVTNGREDTELNGYYRVIDTEIVNNTFVNCDFALRIGTQVEDDLDEEPINLTLANNIMFNTSIDAFEINTNPSGLISEGNITDVPTGDMAFDGELGFYALVSGSSPIDAGVGSYSFLTNDILSANRPANFDAGAEEFGAGGTRTPYTIRDVGINVGFIGEEVVLPSFISINPDTFETGRLGVTKEFNITSDVAWTISENLNWITVSQTSGEAGSINITVTIDENGEDSERNGIITVNGEGDDVSNTINITQNNEFSAFEIEIVGHFNAIGGERDDEGELRFLPEFSYNDNISNYWSGNAFDEPEVSIVYDLGCTYELDEIGINFWKANERSTKFSIAISDEVDGPFNVVLDGQDSEGGEEVSVIDEQRFDISNNSARYVKLIGLGNSEGTGWSSFANVNIYSNPANTTCVEETTSFVTVTPDNYETDAEATSTEFTISSNVAWTISEDLDWITVNTTSGESGSTDITVTIEANEGSSERSGIITINGDDGVNDTISIIQAAELVEPATPYEIEIVDFINAEGTEQDSDGTLPNPPANSFNDDISNYWTGNAFEEAEVSIVYDLGCVYELDEIGINFWKADERTTTFSIATATEEGGPFNIIIDAQESDGSVGISVETEQKFVISNNNARYVKLIGLGNNSGSGWSSFANVNIYSNPANTTCIDGVLNIVDNDLGSQGIKLYPIPVINGELYIKSSELSFENIRIYNLSGQKVVNEYKGKVKNTTINIASLKRGVYFVEIDDLGISTIVVN